MLGSFLAPRHLRGRKGLSPSRWAMSDCKLCKRGAVTPPDFYIEYGEQNFVDPSDGAEWIDEFSVLCVDCLIFVIRIIEKNRTRSWPTGVSKSPVEDERSFWRRVHNWQSLYCRPVTPEEFSEAVASLVVSYANRIKNGKIPHRCQGRSKEGQRQCLNWASEEKNGLFVCRNHSRLFFDIEDQPQHIYEDKLVKAVFSALEL